MSDFLPDSIAYFGYERVTPEEKTQKVSNVFHSVAKNYDLMNDLMSFGIHRIWKRFAIEQCNPKPGQIILDLAGGTGDLTKLLARRVGKQGKVILADINNSMLTEGRHALTNEGFIENIDFVQANAENLPFDDNSFDNITIAFGLRNVTHIDRALTSMYRVLKPGGKLIILEFSKPIIPGLTPIYDAFSFTVLPFLGKLIANDSDSYKYLAESIRKHPDQNTLKDMLLSAGFDECNYLNLSGGIVALHKGVKY